MATKLGSAYVDIAANLANYEKGLKKGKKQTSQFVKDVDRTLASIDFKTLAKGAAVFTAGLASVAGAIYTVQRAWGAFESGARRMDAMAAFRNLSTSIGANAVKIINDVRKASNEMLSLQDTIDSTGRAMMLGLDPKTITKLMEVARASTKITGQTIEAAFGDTTLGVARQSKMILGNLGLQLDYDRHLKRLAGTLGRTTAELNDAEKRQAFLNATFEAGDEIIERVGGGFGSLTDKIGQFKTTVKDAKNDVVDFFFGLGIKERGVAAARFGHLTEQYGEQKKKLDELLPRYHALKATIDDMLSGKREPSLKILSDFEMLESQAIVLQKSMNSISKMFGIGDTQEVFGRYIGGLQDAQIAQEEAAKEATRIQAELDKESEKRKQQEIRTAAEITRTYESMYDALGFEAKGYYNFRKDLLEKQREAEITITGDMGLAWEAYYARMKELDTERLRHSGNAMDGVRLFFEEDARQQNSWASETQAGMEDFKQNMKDTSFSIVRRTATISEAFENMAMSILDSVAKIATNMAVNAIFSAIGNSMGGLSTTSTGSAASPASVGTMGGTSWGGNVGFSSAQSMQGATVVNNNYKIEATDADSFVKLLKRNRGALNELTIEGKRKNRNFEKSLASR